MPVRQPTPPGEEQDKAPGLPDTDDTPGGTGVHDDTSPEATHAAVERLEQDRVEQSPEESGGESMAPAFVDKPPAPNSPREQQEAWGQQGGQQAAGDEVPMEEEVETKSPGQAIKDDLTK